MTTRGWSDEASEVLRVGDGFRLADVDPDSHPGYDGDKKSGVADLAIGIEALGELQDRLHAESLAGSTTDAVLLVLQAMDSAGKGGIVRHVVGGVDPQGVALTAPSRRRRPRSASTTSCGASTSGFQNPVSSESSTARITRMC